MQLTLETDYAIRIVAVLAKNQKRMFASEIAEQTSVTLRFALKILRKLVGEGIVQSFKGKQGGYILAKEPADITLLQVVEAIEGTVFINRCLRDYESCNRGKAPLCVFHHIFEQATNHLRQELDAVNFENIFEIEQKLPV
jgi:Rrf2 family protein